MRSSKPFIEQNIHPSVIVKAYFKALDKVKTILDELAVDIDLEKEEDVKKALISCIGTKFASRWGDLIVQLAL